MKILQVSGYPRNTCAANVSLDTTYKEIKTIEGIPLTVFREQNINMLFGHVNVMEYGNVMLNLPSADDLIKEIRKK